MGIAAGRYLGFDELTYPETKAIASGAVYVYRKTDQFIVRHAVTDDTRDLCRQQYPHLWSLEETRRQIERR